MYVELAACGSNAAHLRLLAANEPFRNTLRTRLKGYTFIGSVRLGNIVKAVTKLLSGIVSATSYLYVANLMVN